MKKLIGLFAQFLVLAASLPSCTGYHLGSGSLSENYRTISIPYITGDVDGAFQAELVKQIANGSPFLYLSQGGSLELKVSIKDRRAEPIGFRRAVDENGKQVDTLVASEDRISVLAEVLLIDTASCCTVMGPIYFNSHADLDFQPDWSNADLVQFSLGQLDFRGAARDAAHGPLFQHLAKQIVDYIDSTW